ncbi:L-threonylcarbamoyladenylate synthase [Vibrio nitrifigilis]|uniref:Threonylcarbamoyl-AMP synthase n=1 Tax=Vibrio nitrifigilis TaxID=2789781 RepID=A0ABS0GHY5_9VIBR|nr:L-threonylcarbamoyladenylate synthase [Vibrio nitrifigilis]MBF9002043.1 threonylcarbamoyl-AMP synthase [Vibrio nitrifigilis]
MVTTINREVSLNTLQLSANSAQDQQHAASLLKLGKLVALPTETVYGLAADATQPEAVKQIFAAKGRPANHPLIVHIGSMDQLKDWAADVPERAITLAKAYWPGPLTFLMRKAEHVSSVVTGGLDTIALRMPAHPVILSLLKEHRLAVAAPSANPYKQLSPTNAEQVLSGLDGRIDAVVDGGDCLFGLESTIIDLTSETVRVLRAGPITAHDISTTLGEAVNYPQHHDVSVPGNVGSHYQPKTLLRLVDDIKQALSQRDKSLTYAVIHTTDLIHNEFTGNDIASIEMPNDATRYGNKLYRSLAEADKLQLDEIWLERPPQGEAWNAVNDRLSRAALPM